MKIHTYHIFFCHIKEWSPTLLAPGTGFVEDNFSTEKGGGDGSGNNAGDGSRSNASDGERQMKFCSPAAHLLLCSSVPNRPRTVAPALGTPDIKNLYEQSYRYRYTIPFSSYM